jgi:molybdenum cofactor cytidylyltransferase
MSIALAEALRLYQSCTVAFTGSGGKTTAIFQLARQMKKPVIVTATSHLGVWQVSMADRHIIAQSPDGVLELDLNPSNITLVTGEIDGERTKPIPEAVLQALHAYCEEKSITLLVEADGSRQRPLKAWAQHEPPVPGFTDVLVRVVGLRGLGKPLAGEFVHRAERFSAESDLRPGDTIDRDAILRVLLKTESAQIRFPSQARRIVLLNQADSSELQAAAQAMAGELLSKYQAVIVASLAKEEVFAVHEPVAGIILAAGESTRYGKPKQLLDWHSEPFARVVSRKAVESGMKPVILVTGAHADEVGYSVADLGIEIVNNEDWRRGQAGSIKAGLQYLAHGSNGFNAVGACVFLLVDQPHITPSILRALMEKHAEGMYPILAPMVMDRRANPVLFDRNTFEDLLTLEGDTGGRGIFHKHRVEYLPWHDDRLLLDVDTPEQYQRLIADDSL